MEEVKPLLIASWLIFLAWLIHPVIRLFLRFLEKIKLLARDWEEDLFFRLGLNVLAILFALWVNLFLSGILTYLQERLVAFIGLAARRLVQ